MISIISRTYWPETKGGAEKYIYEIKSLLDNKTKFKIYTWNKSNDTDVNTITIPKVKILGSLAFSIKAAMLANKDDSRLIHLSQYWSEYASYFLKKKYVASIYDIPTDSLRMRIMLHCANHASRIVYISEIIKNELIKKGVNRDKFVYAPPGVDEAVRKIKHRNHKKLNFLHVSRIAPNKDLITIIRALGLLKNDYDFQLNIAGQIMEWSDYHKRVKEEIKKQGLDKRIKLLGPVSEKEKFELMSITDVYLHASINGDGFGMPIVEAQAAGIPVVTTDLYEETGVARKDFNASIFKRRDYVGMSNEIKKVITDDYYRKKIVTNGLKSSIKYNWSESAKIIKKMYDELL